MYFTKEELEIHQSENMEAIWEVEGVFVGGHGYDYDSIQEIGLKQEKKVIA